MSFRAFGLARNTVWRQSFRPTCLSKVASISVLLPLGLPLALGRVPRISVREKLFRSKQTNMKRFLGIFVTSLFFAAPMLVAQERGQMDHVEVGAFVNYFRLTDPGPTRNFIGLGGRAAVGIRPSIQLEAEMAYDFKRNYTSTFDNGVSSTAVNSRLRTLHGFFGPKFQTGSGAFRAFVSGKVGFDNFSVTNANAPTGFTNAVGLNSATYFALYPSAGIEAFAGPIGLRLEAGDDIFFNGGAHNNLRVSVGPQFRF